MDKNEKRFVQLMQAEQKLVFAYTQHQLALTSTLALIGQKFSEDSEGKEMASLLRAASAVADQVAEMLRKIRPIWEETADLIEESDL